MQVHYSDKQQPLYSWLNKAQVFYRGICFSGCRDEPYKSLNTNRNSFFLVVLSGRAEMWKHGSNTEIRRYAQIWEREREVRRFHEDEDQQTGCSPFGNNKAHKHARKRKKH